MYVAIYLYLYIYIDMSIYLYIDIFVSVSVDAGLAVLEQGGETLQRSLFRALKRALQQKRQMPIRRPCVLLYSFPFSCVCGQKALFIMGKEYGFYFCLLLYGVGTDSSALGCMYTSELLLLFLLLLTLPLQLASPFVCAAPSLLAADGVDVCLCC